MRAVDLGRLESEMASAFYQAVELSADYPGFSDRMKESASLKDFLKKDLDKAEPGLSEILYDIYDRLDYAVFMEFDHAEDSVKGYLLQSKKNYQPMIDEMNEAGIVAKSEGPFKLSEDTLEEFYLPAFEAFDKVREALFDKILSKEPAAFYEEGKQAVEAYKKAKGLLMDEQDFCTLFLRRLETERLRELFAKKIYDSIHYHPHYVLEPFEQPDEAEEASEELEEELQDDDFDPEDEAERYRKMRSESAEAVDGVLVSDRDLDPSDYLLVESFLEEYVGRRVIPSEENEFEYAHWLTYEEEFLDLLHLFVMSSLEETLRYVNREKPYDFGTLARYLHLSGESREDIEALLIASDKIGYCVLETEESLWESFIQDELMPYYELGRELSQDS